MFAGLDVAVRDAGPVRHRQGVGHGPQNPQHLTDRERADLKALLKGRPADHFPDDVGDHDAITEVAVAVLINLGDRRMRQLRECPGHEPEPRLRHGIADEVRLECFDRYFTAGMFIHSTPNGTRDVTADRLDQAQPTAENRSHP